MEKISSKVIILFIIFYLKENPHQKSFLFLKIYGPETQMKVKKLLMAF